MIQISEKIAPGLHRVWDVYKVLYQGKTRYQDILIGETAQGVTLFCDNERQSSELTQLLYHECQIVPALLATTKRDKALVIGSSEGVVPKILQEEGFKQIDHVDIDEEAVELCAKYLPYGYTAANIKLSKSTVRGQHEMFDMSRIGIFYQDGHEFVKNSKEQYDIISMDLPDEPPWIESQDPERELQLSNLYSEDSLSLMRDHLTESGVFITQAGCASLWRNGTLKDIWKRMTRVFGTHRVECFDSDEQDWCWVLGAQDDGEGLPLVSVATHMLKYQPRHITDDVIMKATVLPHAIRYMNA